MLHLEPLKLPEAASICLSICPLACRAQKVALHNVLPIWKVRGVLHCPASELDCVFWHQLWHCLGPDSAPLTSQDPGRRSDEDLQTTRASVDRVCGRGGIHQRP